MILIVIFFNFNREIGVTKGFLIKFNFGFGIRVSSHGKFFKMGVSARHPVFVESLWVHLMNILKISQWILFQVNY